jgi:competence/damage-inducible protein CinA-like protein
MTGACAHIIAVGSELLTASRIDTNSLAVTERLNAIGMAIAAKLVVGDDRKQIAAAMHDSLDHADLVVVTGGLGPTDDDVTREAAAAVFGVPLQEDATILEGIRRRFASRGLEMPEINRRQAMVPEGAEVLSNPRGTAPGLWIEEGLRRLLLLPGPPQEMQPMLDAWAARHGERLGGGMHIVRRVLKVANVSESHVEEMAQPVYARWRESGVPLSVTILAAPGQIELHLTATAASAKEADAALDPAVDDLVEALHGHVFTTRGETLEAVVGRLLLESGSTIALAESCTGGLLASRLTDIPGSSAYVLGGVVAYSNALKIDLLGVPAALIDEHGAVSEPVAVAMADGVKARSRASLGVGITGIAGPGGGSSAKPVGTVAIALSTPEGAKVRMQIFRGDRHQIKFGATQAALDDIRRLFVRAAAQ